MLYKYRFYAASQKIGITGFVFDKNSNLQPYTYLRTPDGKTEPIGVGLLPYAINNKTQIVGEYVPPNTNNPLNAFLWDRTNGARNLGVLGTRSNGDSFSTAYGINNKSQVVGRSTTNTSTSGFIWSNGVMTDLQSLINPNSGWTIQDAWAINDNGYIVGNGTFNGKERAFILAPFEHESTSIPEPASILGLTNLAFITFYYQWRFKRISHEKKHRI